MRPSNCPLSPQPTNPASRTDRLKASFGVTCDQGCLSPPECRIRRRNRPGFRFTVTILANLKSQGFWWKTIFSSPPIVKCPMKSKSVSTVLVATPENILRNPFAQAFHSILSVNDWLVSCFLGTRFNFQPIQ